MLVQRCAHLRAVAAGRNVVHVFADGSNAFACTQRADLDEYKDAYVSDPFTREFMAQRDHNAVVCIAAADRDLAVKPSQGALMGTESAPRDFCGVYSKSITEWDMELRWTSWTRYRFFVTRDPISQIEVDLSTTVFVDDVFKLAVASDSPDAVESVEFINDRLTSALGRRSYKQNVDKQIVLPHFHGGRHSLPQRLQFSLCIAYWSR